MCAKLSHCPQKRGTKQTQVSNSRLYCPSTRAHDTGLQLRRRGHCITLNFLLCSSMKVCADRSSSSLHLVFPSLRFLSKVWGEPPGQLEHPIPRNLRSPLAGADAKLALCAVMPRAEGPAAGAVANIGWFACCCCLAGKPRSGRPSRIARRVQCYSFHSPGSKKQIPPDHLHQGNSGALQYVPTFILYIWLACDVIASYQGSHVHLFSRRNRKMYAAEGIRAQKSKTASMAADVASMQAIYVIAARLPSPVLHCEVPVLH